MARSSTFRPRGGCTLPGGATRAESPKARAKHPCGRIWPNGEFGLSWHHKTEECDTFSPNRAGGVRVSAIREECRDVADNERWITPWLVKSAKSAQRPETYGRKGITGYGAKMVRNGAHLLQDKYGKSRLGFLTLTVPEYEKDDLTVIAQGWNYLVKSLLQGLRRLLEKVGLPSSIVLVTELQPRRLDDGSLGCLHLHLVFVAGWGRGRYAYSPFVYKALWLRLLSNLLGKTLECSPCENIQPVKKDAGNYLSKYLSKGSEDISEFAEIAGWECVPRQWWSATVSIKKAVKKFTISGEQMMSLLDELLWNYWKKGGVPNTEGVVFSRPITIKATKYQDFVIGYFGKIDRETYEDLLALRGVLKSA